MSEPPTFRSEVQRAIHYTTASLTGSDFMKKKTQSEIRSATAISACSCSYDWLPPERLTRCNDIMNPECVDQAEIHTHNEPYP